MHFMGARVRAVAFDTALGDVADEQVCVPRTELDGCHRQWTIRSGVGVSIRDQCTRLRIAAIDGIGCSSHGKWPAPGTNRTVTRAFGSSRCCSVTN